MATQFDVFVKGPETRSIFQDVFGNGLFNKDGEEWHSQRKTAAKFFSARTLRLMMAHTMKRNMKQVSDVLDARVGTGEFVDLTLLFHQFTLQTFMEVGVGVDFPIIGNDTQVPLEQALADSLPITARRRILPMFFWKLMRWLNVGEERHLKEAMQIVRTKIHELVSQSLSRKRESDENSTDETIRSAVELFVEHSSADQVGLRPEDLVDFVLNFVVAARDTSSLATSWLFLVFGMLICHGSKLKRRLCAVSQS